MLSNQRGWLAERRGSGDLQVLWWIGWFFILPRGEIHSSDSEGSSLVESLFVCFVNGPVGGDTQEAGLPGRLQGQVYRMPLAWCRLHCNTSRNPERPRLIGHSPEVTDESARPTSAVYVLIGRSALEPISTRSGQTGKLLDLLHCFWDVKLWALRVDGRRNRIWKLKMSEPTEPLHKAPPPVQLHKAPWWTGCVGDLVNVNHSLFCSGRHGRKEKRCQTARWCFWDQICCLDMIHVGRLKQNKSFNLFS